METVAEAAAEASIAGDEGAGNAKEVRDARFCPLIFEFFTIDMARKSSRLMSSSALWRP